LEGENKMKIAFVSDNGKNVSQHFGRARYYVVVTVEDGKAVSNEVRDKLGHMHFADDPQHEEQHGSPHGYGLEAQQRHGLMIEAINDCEVLVAGGMGAGARESIRAHGIRPILTNITSIEDAVNAYVGGRLEDHSERVHM
jgi:predicted Fe-Mo cluster-binding NifX family protein